MTGGGGFCLVAQQPLWEMGIWVFARSYTSVEITQVVADTEATGISLGKQVTGMQLGNKGGCGIGLRWRDTSFAFVCCHLAARPERVGSDMFPPLCCSLGIVELWLRLLELPRLWGYLLSRFMG